MFQNLLDNKKISVSLAETGKDFVGFKADHSSINVVFPLGYKLPDMETVSEKEFRKLLAELILAINDEGKKKEGVVESYFIGKDDRQYEIPMSACIFLIKDYLKNGLYNEKEVVRKKANSGRIDWQKTIKQIRPVVDENLNLVYLDFIVRKSRTNKENLVSLIHQYAVWLSFSVAGFMFSNTKIQKPAIKYNQKLFLSIIRQKMKMTFSAKDNILFANIIALLEKWDVERKKENFAYGTRSFEHVWEHMVDTLYGNCGKFSKEQFFPEARWFFDDDEENHSHNASNLIPDTISFYEGKCYILDSKYYAIDRHDTSSYPSMGSISKQIIYGEYMEAHAEDFNIKEPEKNIYNVFLIPYSTVLDADNPYKLEYIGFATEPWKFKKTEIEKSYYKIYSFKLNINNLLSDYFDINRAMKTLAEAVVECEKKEAERWPKEKIEKKAKI